MKRGKEAARRMLLADDESDITNVQNNLVMCVHLVLHKEANLQRLLQVAKV